MDVYPAICGSSLLKGIDARVSPGLYKEKWDRGRGRFACLPVAVDSWFGVFQCVQGVVSVWMHQGLSGNVANASGLQFVYIGWAQFVDIEYEGALGYIRNGNIMFTVIDFFTAVRTTIQVRITGKCVGFRCGSRDGIDGLGKRQLEAFGVGFHALNFERCLIIFYGLQSVGPRTDGIPSAITFSHVHTPVLIKCHTQHSGLKTFSKWKNRTLVFTAHFFQKHPADV